MRIPALLVASIAALLTVGALAQQPVPDAPQPQKKQTAKPPDPAPAPPTPPPAKDDNAFPEDVSKKAAEAASQTKQPGDANAFPEAQSQAAAKAAAKEPPPYRLGAEPPAVNDPARARRDDEVGKFYLQSGDYHGALLRYQDATASDPTNVNAIFGLAEAQRLLKKNADAARNYELYLDIVPNGPKAKQALKALKEIQAGK
jgi:tetratricopeptide (TPR) repeat protein